MRALLRIVKVSPGAPWGMINEQSVLTAVKGAQLVACLLRIVHALEEGSDAGIVLAPEVVGDCSTVSLESDERVKFPHCTCPMTSYRKGRWPVPRLKRLALRLTEQERSRGFDLGFPSTDCDDGNEGSPEMAIPHGGQKLSRKSSRKSTTASDNKAAAKERSRK